MVRYYKIVLMIFLLFTSVTTFSQNIKGKIIDANTQEALSFANVAVMSARDSSIITGTVSDEEGRFSVAIPDGKLFARISLIGYETYISDIAANDMGIIKLNPSKEMLSEVVVT